MPLIQGKSRKAVSKNIATEMEHGKPQKQAIAIAYSVKRKNAHKKAAGGSVKSGSKDMDMNRGGMAYAEGGEVSVPQQRLPMPEREYNDAKEISRNKGNKPPHNDNWLDNPTVKQAQNNSGRMVKPIKHPKMVPQSLYSTRLCDEEDDLQSSASPGPYGEQPPKHDDEEGPDRQGPKVPDMEDEHSTHRKPYAKGGEVESSDYDHPMNKYEHDYTHDTPSHDEGESHARSLNEISPDRQGPDISDHEEPHYMSSDQYEDAEDYDHDMELNPAHDKHSPDDSEDQPREEADMDHEDSIAAAIMAKKARSAQDSDSDMDRMAMMALGGEILEDDGDIHSHGSMDSDDSDQVDLSRNADEDANEEDQASYDALRRENYSESEGLKDLTYSSESKGDKEESDSENRYDRIDRMRSRMNARRQFKVR